MPTFTYKCKDCGHVFDFLLLDKDEKPSCPKCQSTAAEKQITGCNVSGSKSTSSHGGGCSCCPHRNS